MASFFSRVFESRQERERREEREQRLQRERALQQWLDHIKRTQGPEKRLEMDRMLDELRANTYSRSLVDLQVYRTR